MTWKSASRDGFDPQEFERRVEAKASEKVSLERRLARIEVYQEMFHRQGGICDQHGAAIEHVQRRVMAVCSAFAVLVFLVQMFGPKLFKMFME